MKFVTDFRDPIKIQRAEYFKLSPLPLPVPFKDATGQVRYGSLFGDWVRLYDADGVCGEGPCTSLVWEYFVPILLKLESMTLNELRTKLYWSIRNFGYQSFHVRELGALDMILLDLLSRRSTQPLHRFLGARKDFACVYKGGGSVLLSDEDLVNDILRFKSEGYHQTKIKVGGTDDWHRDIERVEKIRKAVGDDFGIAVDANQKWDVDTAFDFMKAVIPLGVSWMEEPIHAYDMEGLQELTERIADAGIDLDVAMGESVRSYYEHVQYADHGVRHIQPANAALWNIDEYMKCKQLADERGLMLSSGGITFINVVLGALYDEHQLIEYHQPIMEVIVPYLSLSCRIDDGKFYLPDVTGTPMRMNFEKLQADGLLQSIQYKYR